MNESEKLMLAALGAELEFEFISTREVIALHDESIDLFGGSVGVRDRALLESAVSRQLQTAVYESGERTDIAASLAYGVCANHAFLDGNKRTSWLAMQRFLQRNGYQVDVDPVESYQVFIRLASGRLTQDDLAGWIRANEIAFHPVSEESPESDESSHNP